MNLAALLAALEVAGAASGAIGSLLDKLKAQASQAGVPTDEILAAITRGREQAAKVSATADEITERLRREGKI